MLNTRSLWFCLALAPLFFGPASAAEPLSGEALPQLVVPGLPASAVVMNHPVDVQVLDGALVLTSPGKRNLFASPGGGYHDTSAPMVLMPSDDEFVLTVRVAAPLVHVYDVAALVVYGDENNWAKLCYENSVDKEPTVVSVVNRGVSDDCNSSVIGADHVYYAIVRKGAEFAFHWSRDGESWHLVRHFRLESATPLRVGFAVHGISEENLTGTFSSIRYVKGTPKGMRELRL